MAQRKKSQSQKRWTYIKRISPDGDVREVFRARGDDTQVLICGKWSPIDASWLDVKTVPNLFVMTAREVSNLLSVLRAGQEDLPSRLELEPYEQYQKWKCPNCQTMTVVPILIGMPSEEVGQAAMRGDVLLQGCIVYGDEPDRPVGCTTCDWYGEHVRGATIRKLPPSRAFEPEPAPMWAKSLRRGRTSSSSSTSEST
jgi:hypothetical protein